MKNYNYFLSVGKHIYGIVLVLMICSLSAFSNPKIEISGQVKDKTSKENLIYCSVRFFNEKDSLVAGTITNEDGFFTLFLERGKYKILINNVGYLPVNKEIVISDQQKFIGIFTLEVNEIELKEISVKGQKNEKSIEKETILVTNQMRIGASKTDDVLTKIQGVSYDRYNNTIKVDGNKNIVFLVNGLEKDPDYIRNLSPDRIQKIEIIRDPSGRYALEGYAAIINVLLKNDYRGSELYVDNQVLFDFDAVKPEKIFAIDNFSATYNYTYNNLNFYTTLGNNLTNINLYLNNQRYFSSDSSMKKIPFDDKFNLDVFQFRSNVTAGLDYYVNPKHIISYEGNMALKPLGADKTNIDFDVHILSNNIETDRFTEELNQTEKAVNSHHTVFYKGIIDNKNSLTADFSMSKYTENNTVKNFLNDIIINDENVENTKYFAGLNVEWNNTINNKMNLNVGYGNSWRKTENQLFSELESTPVEFEYSENRNKLYAYYTINFNNQLSAKAGLAGELCVPEIEGKSRKLYLIQPHADFKYSPSENFSVKIQYRSSGIYPSISEASPITNYLDAQTVKTGNPYLDPTVIHKVSLRFDVLQGLLSVEPYYHFSNNYIIQTGHLRQDGIYEYTYSNKGSYQNQGIKGNLTIPFGKSLFIQSSLDFYRSQIDFTGKSNKINDWKTETQLIYVNEKYNTVAGFIFQKSNTKVIMAQGWRMEDNDFWLIFVQQPFLKDRLNIMLAYMPPINWGASYSQDTYTENGQYNDLQKADISLLKNLVLFKVSYRFSKGAETKQNKKDVILEDQKKGKGLF